MTSCGSLNLSSPQNFPLLLGLSIKLRSRNAGSWLSGALCFPVLQRSTRLGMRGALLMYLWSALLLSQKATRATDPTFCKGFYWRQLCKKLQVAHLGPAWFVSTPRSSQITATMQPDVVTAIWCTQATFVAKISVVLLVDKCGSIGRASMALVVHCWLFFHPHNSSELLGRLHFFVWPLWRFDRLLPWVSVAYSPIAWMSTR